MPSVARIGDEDAAEPPVRQPLADLDEQAVVDLAESAFLDDQRQQVGARGGDQLAAALAGIGVDAVVDREGDDAGEHRQQHASAG